MAGIGLTKAGKVQYRALTQYLLSASDFLDNYHALKQACTDLIGTSGITAADCAEVNKALDAVEMSEPWPCSPLQAAVPDLCPTGTTPTNLFFDDLENTGSGNWTITNSSGVTHWSYPTDPAFVFANSGVQNFWGYDYAVWGDSAIAMNLDVGIPAGGARLQFNHSFGFENDGAFSYYDGGVVEYSTDSGATWFDAGSLIWRPGHPADRYDPPRRLALRWLRIRPAPSGRSDVTALILPMRKSRWKNPRTRTASAILTARNGGGTRP